TGLRAGNDGRTAPGPRCRRRLPRLYATSRFHGASASPGYPYAMGPWVGGTSASQTQTHLSRLEFASAHRADGWRPALGAHGAKRGRGACLGLCLRRWRHGTNRFVEGGGRVRGSIRSAAWASGGTALVQPP
ncbi:hypothetical protein FOMPIDRAFT_1026524, partial [Fomitopsis schrenkii]